MKFPVAACESSPVVEEDGRHFGGTPNWAREDLAGWGELAEMFPAAEWFWFLLCEWILIF